jgi:hypothetical protein
VIVRPHGPGVSFLQDRPEDGIIVGDYTFFLDNSGPIIPEPAEPTAAAPAGEVLKLGCWSDQDQTKVTTHDPEPTRPWKNGKTRHMT